MRFPLLAQFNFLLFLISKVYSDILFCPVKIILMLKHYKNTKIKKQFVT